MTQNKIYIFILTTFKEISVEDYKKLLDNRQHTFARTFKNVELDEKNNKIEMTDYFSISVYIH